MNRKTKINIQEISREKFLQARNCPEQERVRRIILKAFSEADTNPKDYREFLISSEQHVGSVANWVHLALEWAKEISEQDSWDICTKIDDDDFHKVVLWEDGYVILTGGSRKYKYPKTHLHDFLLKEDASIPDTISAKILRVITY